MQYHQLVNTLLDAQTEEYPKRRFHLTKLLGSGSKGGAFLASSSDWGNNPKQVVIKIQKNMKPNEKQFLSCLLEYQNLYENGNNQQYLPTYLIRIYENFQWQQNHCIVMEVGQEDLYRFINNSRNVSIQEKEKICFQIIYPILFLHKQQLIHRDIKPENYIKVGNVFKLIDFGLIRSSISENKTQQVGSTIFQAPEIIENSSSYTDKVDIWSLGCVFYEILATQPLFDGQTHQEVTKNIKNHKNYPVPVNQKINQLQISQQLKTILISMLIYDEKKRPSIQQVYDQFNSYLNPQPIVIPQIPLHLDQYITQCNDVIEKLIKDGQQQIKDTLTNQKSFYEGKINELKNEFQTQNKINQNKIDQQSGEINELIKQVENLNQQKKQLEYDQQNFKLEIERFKQKIKDEEVKFNTEKNQLNKEIKEFEEKINKMNQFSENLKKENENKNQELQKLFIKNQNNETLIQEIQDKLKESSTSLNKAKSLVDIFQNQEKVQKSQIQTQDQQSIIQEITYTQEQKSENPYLNISSSQEYNNLIENLRLEFQKQGKQYLDQITNLKKELKVLEEQQKNNKKSRIQFKQQIEQLKTPEKQVESLIERFKNKQNLQEFMKKNNKQYLELVQLLNENFC
ncbi:unnamed protein product [Paramecium primaurelia]|uniref:Protein kinase domain-containing protein n=1 Tax=Paramecium primaurelia TaxID=5886 RepID=A0A8S1QK60_PARPR|nr:unnamed protein product [Paramecium primaurelia]